MKSILIFAITFSLTVFLISSCKKESREENGEGKKEVTQTIIDQIHRLGLSTKNITVLEEGKYLVEGDIIVTKEQLDNRTDAQFLRVGEEEQYRTINVVRAVPRTIRVRFSGYWNSSILPVYTSALDVALGRYNALGLNLSFQRVSSSSSAEISLFVTAGVPYLASAGFPTAAGEPYNQILVNTPAIVNIQNYIASILAHEIGHCIGFRHTDYMNRSYSCGGTPVNEGDAGVGAIHVPGTPTNPDARSWMLACFIAGEDRPMNSNDVTALKYLYARVIPPPPPPPPPFNCLISPNALVDRSSGNDRCQITTKSFTTDGCAKIVVDALAMSQGNQRGKLWIDIYDSNTKIHSAFFEDNTDIIGHTEFSIKTERGSIKNLRIFARNQLADARSVTATVSYSESVITPPHPAVCLISPNGLTEFASGKDECQITTRSFSTERCAKMVINGLAMTRGNGRGELWIEIYDGQSKIHSAYFEDNTDIIGQTEFAIRIPAGAVKNLRFVALNLMADARAINAKVTYSD